MKENKADIGDYKALFLLTSRRRGKVSLSKKERMSLLLKQIELSEEMVETYFLEAEIEKLEVFKEQKL